VKDKLKVRRYLDAMTKEYDALERCNVGSEAKNLQYVPKRRVRLFTDKETKIVNEATDSLPNNATRAMIVDALSQLELAIDAGLVSGGKYSNGQLRDNFHSIRRNK
jgi:hypothetical protein